MKTENSKVDWEQKNTIQKASGQNTENLPRVLLLGDSISLGYTPFVMEMMKDKAFVTRPETNCGPSEFYLEQLDSWLRNETWDVVHVNFGIWDNHYMTPEGGIFFTPREWLEGDEIITGKIRQAGNVIRTPEPQYEENMRVILSKIQKQSSHVIFALTTPMPMWKKDDRMARIPVYNEIARRVCADMNIDVNDLYSAAMPHLDLQTDGCHYSAEGYKILADAVCRKISEYL